ncbi:hypothetical protein CHLNCDRAFT_139278 [Chlorella variabilis]|uniref:Protein kinase domain-containing protein n=1 Tax=Chlorella variabilis TaxID=554065 RepID=E1ZPX9_CHLVA|nr:hypothetical protein CHLNCDRAFT_139278 [Chlorella variabilis]EFN52058.1 hypothetical protein CHLNCDRAFT_139278 [Chlorella variabilis]|eukprot:XP_005844160.1 hypothetical protein CHLNCDRAFT_139278 [Chlorella variabilis]
MSLAATYARLRTDLLNVAGVDVTLLDETVAHFQQATCKADASLRRSIIHSDANEKNILVDAAAAEAAAAAEQQEAAVATDIRGESLITGLIDRPDNAEYLLSTQKNGWRLLRLLRGLSDEQFLAAVAPASPF